ncbi:hypothetical protein [Algoriphagus litoralis]|uniref:hypothetical protein n=1 Tax=Algoriphagus litoralis TaxID=2202829 RepID=UPI000DBA278B|nr:hypothetical protein [Algoriphagus litoralis]
MDKKAKDILFKTYWTSAGWVRDENRKIEEADFKYAKEKGLMFDPLTISKAEIISKLESLTQTISKKKVTDAFLSSLSNKRLDWRSGLASYENAKRLLTEKDINDYYFGHGENEDLNVLNFERIKWGGVRHYSGLYNSLDLSLLDKETVSLPTKNDIEIFKSILKVIDNSEYGEPPSKLRDRIKEVYKASKSELSVLMEILGCADIIKPLRFDRKVPGKHDWTFVLHWRGEDKYYKQKVKEYFGEYGIE